MQRVEVISSQETAVRTVVDIDDELLDAARAALGTTTKVETVNRALAEVVALVARRRHLERLCAGGLPDLGDEALYDAAWR
ncbi:MAG TPA: type II toxin-antitoxin system VapB family antitoxin [Acidimicrobiales bacterium]|nr:type II toxin-antitoxin system VapB family antitoxin [Acidimicrobiales bacterium]